MEESIKNAEKLIRAMNVALAQMKHDASYDDFGHVIGVMGRGEKKIRKALLDEDRGISLLRADDFPGAHEEAAIPDDLFNSSGFPDLRTDTGFAFNEDDAKIEEINNKIEVYRQELMERAERESLRAMRVEGLSKPSAAKSTECLTSNALSASDAYQKSPSLKTGKSNAVTVAEDLRSKLLQTREIVDRGIQTAKELSETVEMLKTKPSKSDRCEEETQISRVTKSKSSEKIAEESNSRSTLSSSVYKKCRKCNSEIICKGKSKDRAVKKRENVLVMNLRGRDSGEKLKHRKLHTQHLPSLDIRGDLKYQKIPNVDILPGKYAVPQIHANTSFEFYTHEQILRDKFEKVSENVKQYDAVCQPKSLRSIQTAMCPNCGKAVKLSNKTINSEQIDELLKACNYNVFDPRIDEFVEKCGATANEEATFLRTQESSTASKDTHQAKECSGPRRSKNSDVSKSEQQDFEKDSSDVRKMKISEFSDELMRKYKDKAIEMEEDHLQFENILRDLFKKIDESRHLFNNCDYLSKILGKNPEKKSNLSITTPVILSYTGGGEEADDGKNAMLRPNKKRSRKGKMEEWEMRKKTGRKVGKANSKLLSSFEPIREAKKVEGSENSEIQGEKDKLHTGFTSLLRENFARPASDAAWSVPRLEEKTEQDVANLQAVMVTGRRSSTPLGHYKSAFSNFEKSPLEGFTSHPLTDSASSNGEAKEAEDAMKNKANQSDYESDFEEESGEIRGVAETRVANMDGSLKYNPNLSTISEVDSEMDRKLGELMISTEDEMENVEREKECHEKTFKQGHSGAADLEPSLIEDVSLRQQREPFREDSEVSPRNAKDAADVNTSSSDDDDTGKLLKKVKEHLQEISSQQLFGKEPSRTDAAENLGAPRTQFEKKETLAEKLSVELHQNETRKETETPFLIINQQLTNNFESVAEDAGKKDIQVEPPSRTSGEQAVQRQPKTELSEKSEINPGDENLKTDPKSSDSKSLFVISENVHLPLKCQNKSECGNKSYSEGEISEQEVFCSEGSSSSIGEVISENNSDSSISEENSVLKFL